MTAQPPVSRNSNITMFHHYHTQNKQIHHGQRFNQPADPLAIFQRFSDPLYYPECQSIHEPLPIENNITNELPFSM